MLRPRTRQARLIIQELDEELLVYDTTRHDVHCLNRSAALVWRCCDGRRTVPELAREVAALQGGTESEEIVWCALDQLAERHLLEEATEREILATTLTRRELMQRLAFTVGLAVPLVTSMPTPVAAQTASGPTGATGATGSTGVTGPTG
jgi:hypothetical protein